MSDKYDWQQEFTRLVCEQKGNAIEWARVTNLALFDLYSQQVSEGYLATVFANAIESAKDGEYNKRHLPKIQSLESKVKELEAQNEKLLKCVEFYANLDSWEQPEIRGYYSLRASSILDKDVTEAQDGVFTGGKLARQTLKESND